ncbi:hypothetical protein BsWGS_28057 [Bradybaena similaris]
MDFIDALEKAQGLGVTKEEFIRVWEAQMKVEPHNEPSGNESQVAPKDSREDCSGEQFGQPGKEALNQALYSRFQALLDEHTQKQEHMWREVHDMKNQKTEEFRRQCEIICQHVSNVVETQMNSLKVYFMHELEVTKQNLGKMIDDLYNKYEVGDLPSAVSLQTAKVDFRHEPGNTHTNNLGFHDKKCDLSGSELLSCAGYTVQKGQDNEHGDAAPDLVYDWPTESLEESPLLKDKDGHTTEDGDNCTETIDNVPPHLNERQGNRSDYVDAARAKENPRVENQKERYPVKPLTHASSVTSLNDASTEATGIYARAISDQIRRRHAGSSSNINDMSASEDWETSSWHGSVDYVRSNKTDLPRSNVFNYLHWDGFYIADFDKYRDSGIKYLSPFLYPGTQSWKARLCVGFDAEKQLKIRVCITEGEGDKHHDWPIRITANGFIFHGNSKCFTQVWKLHWVTCHKPSAKEVIFPAKICLETKRGSYPNVTYDELEAKKYLQNYKAVFKWNLKAEKLQ